MWFCVLFFIVVLVAKMALALVRGPRLVYKDTDH